MRVWLAVILWFGVAVGAGCAETVDLTPSVSGASVTIQDGHLSVAIGRAAIGSIASVEQVKLAMAYKPGPGLLMTPVTSILDLAIQETSLSVATIHLNTKPLEESGVPLPGGFLGSLIKAHLAAFDTKDFALDVRAGKVTMTAKSGIVHTTFEGGFAWGEGTQLAFRVDAIRLNFGLPIPRSLIMKRLAWLDPLDWADVKDNVVLVDVAKLAKFMAESLPTRAHFDLPNLGH